jgi:SAM-dependent methyltransferase
MSMFYKLAYWIGLTPWEEMSVLPITSQIASLLDREEKERQPPYGSSLDLGCGSGIWAVKLAARGWQVTGIDIVAKALRAAHRRVLQSGVEARLIQGDMTALRTAGVGTGFQFVLDLGAIHGLREAQRKSAGREVSAVCADGTAMLLLACVPAQRGPLPGGMSRADIEDTFPEWKLVAEDAADLSGAPGFVRRAKTCFYRLRRE